MEDRHLFITPTRIDLTRMECKDFRRENGLCTKCIDLTRMECKGNNKPVL